MEDSYGCVVARKRGRGRERERERERERGRRLKGVKSMVNSLCLSLLVDRGERKTRLLFTNSATEQHRETEHPKLRIGLRSPSLLANSPR